MRLFSITYIIAGVVLIVFAEDVPNPLPSKAPSSKTSGLVAVKGAPEVSPRLQAAPAPSLYRVTAYCPGPCCCGEWADGITASGLPVTANGGKFVAADKSIPFGTMLNIPGYGYAPVLDRGGAIKGKRIDVFFPTHQEALNWGVKYLNIAI